MGFHIQISRECIVLNPRNAVDQHFALFITDGLRFVTISRMQ